MAIKLKTPDQIELIGQACRVVAQVLDLLERQLAPGMSTWELDQMAHAHCLKCGGEPSFLRLYGFPASLCISVNEEVLHGIPSRLKILHAGDLVSCDFGVRFRDHYGDGARTFCVGEPEPVAEQLMQATQEALLLGIEQCYPGRRLGDVGHAIQHHIESRGFHVVRDYVGHGVGFKPHEDPAVPNYGQPGRGRRLEVGWVIAVEPMVNVGTAEVKVLADHWTVVTRDRSLSAHFEHTVAITKNGPVVLTKS